MPQRPSRGKPSDPARPEPAGRQRWWISAAAASANRQAWPTACAATSSSRRLTRT